MKKKKTGSCRARIYDAPPLRRRRKRVSAFSRRSEMERRQSGARLIFSRTNCAQLSLRFPREPVESKSRSARSGPEVASASINILTYTTWNSRLIYCRYLDALVFGPPGADIICLKKCARQRGPPTTVLPIPPRIRVAPLTTYRSLSRFRLFSLFFFSLFFSLFFSFSISRPRHSYRHRFRRPSRSRVSSSSLSPPRFTRRLLFGPGEIVLRLDSSTLVFRYRDQQVVELDL